MSQKLRLITEYWTNNIKRNEYFLNENDSREGKSLEYYPSGKLKRVSTYHCDEIDGLSITYHENGRIAELTEFDMGMMSGIYLKLDESGNVLVQGHHKFNKPVGNWFNAEEAKPQKIASHTAQASFQKSGRTIS